MNVFSHLKLLTIMEKQRYRKGEDLSQGNQLVSDKSEALPTHAFYSDASHPLFPQSPATYILQLEQ